jgi:RNA polymerase sigma factor (sigma-70 family)
LREAPSSLNAAEPPSAGSSSFRLLLRARKGDREALDLLFARVASPLRRWARGRLPRWARQRADTEDLVQDALAQAFVRLEHFEPRRQKALQAYLRQAVVNRIRDELRWARRRPIVELESLDLTAPVSLFEQAVEQENGARYQAGLARLLPEDQELIVARLELGYSYEQVALATGRATPDAARMAVRRALLRLAAEMSGG